MELSIVIPCLNERETIEKSVTLAKKTLEISNIEGEVVVADNGSTDGSVDIATRAGARVVPVPVRGYGAALHAGILSAQGKVVGFADADMSYPFDEMPKLLEPILQGKAEFVLGSRLGGKIDAGAMPFLNRFLGTPVLSFLIRVLFRIPASDCNSGMRALLKSRYSDLGLRCPGMEYASEMLIRVGQKGLRYFEVPIHFHKDQRSTPPHLRRWRDGWRHLRFILGNAPSLPMVLMPLTLSFLLMIFAFVLSFQDYWDPAGKIHYHSAFIAIALSAPLLMFTVSILLVKIALHISGQTESRLVHLVAQWGEKNFPIMGALVFVGLVGIESAFLLKSWIATGWGPLSEIGKLIRIILYTFCGAALFSFDMGLGILRLVPYQETKRR